MKKPDKTLSHRKLLLKPEMESAGSAKPDLIQDRLVLPIVPIFLSGLFLGGSLLLTLFILYGSY